MTKYIDADALCKGRVSNDPVLIAVKCEPAADVAEVVHGEWVQERGNYATVNHCSVCGVTKWGRSRQTGCCDSQYCGACGAKMGLPFVPLERCPGDVCRGVDRSVEAGKVGV